MKKTIVILFVILSCFYSCKKNEIKRTPKNDIAYHVIVNEVYSYENQMSGFYSDVIYSFKDTIDRNKYTAEKNKQIKTIDEAISLCTRCYELLKKACENERDNEKFSYTEWNKSYTKCKAEYLSFLYRNVKWRYYISKENYDSLFDDLVNKGQLAYILNIEKNRKNENLILLEQEKINISVLLLEVKGALYHLVKL